MDTEKMMEELIRDECKNGQPELKPYPDNAKPPRITIGIGRNLTDVGISLAEAYLFFHNDLDRTMVDLDQYIPWWRYLDENRQRVVLNMAFNMGWDTIDAQGHRHGLKYWPHTLNLMQTHDIEGAALEMERSLWASQVGDRATRLVAMWRAGTPAAA